MQTARSAPSRTLLRLPSLWSAGAAVIACVVLAPILAVIWIALSPVLGGENLVQVWPATLPRYLRTTILLMSGVGLATAMVGTGAAWLVARYRFPGARWIEWALLMPLAVPAYVGAYALVDLLEYAGPVQTFLRGLMGWNSARDYWFPEIRSLGAAIVVLSAALYPYVYLLTRAALREQSGGGEEVAMSLGVGPLGRFRRVALPLARPAIAAGVAIVMMETVNDFGTVDYFAVQTLTTGIFTTWLEANSAPGAAQIACVVLALVVALLLVERVSRRRSRFYLLSSRHRPVTRQPLRGVAGWVAALLCFIPIFLGFLLPAGVILSHAIGHLDFWAEPGLILALWHTVAVGGIAAAVTVLAAVFLVYGVRLSGQSLPRRLLPVTTIGYAAPGAVLGVGILIPLARIDHWMADGVEAVTGFDIGLVLTGSAFALVLAYTVRFFAIAQGAADGAFGRVTPSLPMAARSLGRTPRRVLREVYAPLIRGSLASALLLVFVDCVKELPATLLLRPFNYDTLATRVHEQASLEQLSRASPGAVLIMLVGLVAVGLLARANR
ncbi:putative iron(III) ABC transporter, fused inner membrane subunits [Pseudooceanicola batsensis HTCC2597]|uniref:Putative iron(III) ABC transporter, fused inner membrane subunits n=1 Tax=Pseudooceanicola batsensis (strain ATCC BAA-863 / DSM 15984 / KCTC 12145 / HTCC2597) TaxID=252305 RepID=A3TSY2_PSEBH|nr:iron ABC transporter permease [Pseudooceanicola batsensis]EAQ04759.1 putative iron(III) ABC transporter, fused inner membrane subunits [Pseudooceanicola batsensis HTCC2597]